MDFNASNGGGKFLIMPDQCLFDARLLQLGGLCQAQFYSFEYIIILSRVLEELNEKRKMKNIYDDQHEIG